MNDWTPHTGSRIDHTGWHGWIEGREVTREEYAEWHHWLSPDWIYQEMMKDRCLNCRLPHNDCRCCVGCGQIDADIFGSHGYHCVM